MSITDEGEIFKYSMVHAVEMGSTPYTSLWKTFNTFFKKTCKRVCTIRHQYLEE